MLPPIKSEARVALMSVAAYKDTPTAQLLKAARAYRAGPRFIFQIVLRRSRSYWEPGLSIHN